MKVIKRDGRAVDFDRMKINTAIEKANDEVRKKEKATKEEIEEIIEYIEELDKKRILVEDIQDIIEQKLMEIKRFELAKRYIVYRYTRALVRKKNTTDESILGLIKNNSKDDMSDNHKVNADVVSIQRDLIAGEVSKDLTKRILLPEKISKAHQDGVLYFHDADYFLQPMFNSCLVNISDMLENGTVINETVIERPRTFQEACIILAQIIASVGNSQYGGQSIDIKILGKYLRRSKNRFKDKLDSNYSGKINNDLIGEIVNDKIQNELKEGIRILQYQINTILTTNGKTPLVTLFLNLDKDDPYIEENALIIEEILKQRYEIAMDKKSQMFKFPKLIYVLDEHNCLNGGKYDYLTRLALKCSEKCLYPDYVSAKQMRKNFDGNVFSPVEGGFFWPWKDENGNYKFEGRFNQGIVSINLPQIGIVTGGDEGKFWKELDQRLELCKEALMCRHYALLDVKSNVSPIHWEYGAIGRLEQGEKIDRYLYGGYSNIFLGYVGLYEITKLIKGVSHTVPEGRDFALKLMKHLNETIDRWKKETNIEFSLYETTSKQISCIFAKIDKEKYGNILDITDKGIYTEAYHLACNEKMDIYTKLAFEKEFQELSKGGAISYIDVSDNTVNLEDLIRYVYENIQYVELKIDKNKSES